MASAAKELRYRKEYTVRGSLAHDLDWEVNEHELRHAGEASPYAQEAPPQRRTAQKAKIHTEKRGAGASIPPYAALIFTVELLEIK